MATGSNARIYVRETAQPSPEVIRLSDRWVDLADERLGGQVLACSDEFYAPAQRLLNPGPAQFYFHDENGMRWVDGWETSRRRRSGHEHCVIRLGRRGRITGVVFDTSFFTGNFPVGVELQACRSAADPDQQTGWVPLVPFIELEGHAQRVLRIEDEGIYSHVRLNLHPDGGMARLRVLGDIDRTALGATRDVVDLAALENGARVIGCNNKHFGELRSLISPGPSITWGKGWETRRRREPGHDWAVLELAAPGCIEEIEVDTSYFLANQPEGFSLQGAFLPEALDDALVLNQAMFWPGLIDKQELQGGSLLRISQGILGHGKVTHVRLNIFPDGGVTRLRLRGRVAGN